VSLHLAVAAPLDVRRLVRELGLQDREVRPIPVGPGGAHPVTELVLALARLVGQLDLVTFDTQLDRVATFEGDGVRLSVGPYRPRARTRSKDLFRVERRFVAERLGTWGPDVVSAHWTYEYALGLLDAGHPHLITVHDWAPTILWAMRDKYRAVRLVMQMMTFARGRNFASVSPYMARRVERLIRRPVDVLPNGLGDGWLQGERSSLEGLEVLAANHGFDRRKNVQRLLTAWPLVHHRVPGAHLRLAGHGYEPDGVAHAWAREHDLLDNVDFLGPIDRAEFQGRLRATRAFVHPSLEESFGMVILEAMATGVPVVGGRESGAVPWLLENEAGITVDARDPRSIARGLIRALTDDDLTRRTADAAVARAGSFTATAAATQYVERLETIAGA
jgi:L-malate glycosyltransferase